MVTVAALVAVLSVAATAFGGSPPAPPPVSFSGSYAVNYKVTNVGNLAPTHWLFAVKTACANPCRAVSFRFRLKSEKAWHKHISVYTWNGKGDYVRPAEVFRGYAGCKGKAGGSVPKGYDVKNTSAIRLKTSVNGRVMRFTGVAQDAYVPNAAGRKAGCAPGSYEYAFTGISL